jgi:uncharacterized membrane protein YdjX (TVP38/TMEM64 family)
MRWTLLWTLVVGLILVPFFLFEPQITRFAEAVTRGGASAWVAPLAIGGLLALDVFLPVPSSIVSTAAGALLGLWRGAAVVWTGMMIGCVLGYAVGARGAALATRVVGAASMEQASALMRRYGDLAIVLCRPVPVLAEASVLVAGLVRARFGAFVWLTALSNLGIAVGYAAIGAVSPRVDSFLAAFAGALLVPGAVLLLSRRVFSRPGV